MISDQRRLRSWIGNEVGISHIVDQRNDPRRCAEREPSRIDRDNISLTGRQTIKCEPAKRTRCCRYRVLESIACDHDIGVADRTSVGCRHTSRDRGICSRRSKELESPTASDVAYIRRLMPRACRRGCTSSRHRSNLFRQSCRTRSECPFHRCCCPAG